MFIGDALAMPVHWYYNTEALHEDYGRVVHYLNPLNPHPDSILWRCSYTPESESADILHKQARYWGMKGVHYHQFLLAGENTLNVKLARELLLLLQNEKNCSPRKWLETVVEYMTSPGSHNDTYVEEYLRHFFTNYGRGIDLMECGRKDENHVGGLTLMLPTLLASAAYPPDAKRRALEFLLLTHGGEEMAEAGEYIADLLLSVLMGETLVSAVERKKKKHRTSMISQPFHELMRFEDEVVVGKHFSSACYVPQSVPATLFLALKYADDPEAGMIANTNCGGDNVGRGVILGALFGADKGLKAWPDHWITGLIHPPPTLKV